MSFFQGGSRFSLAVIVLLSAMLCALTSPVASADQKATTINKIKAAFVLNVARFVTWPSEAFKDKNTHLKLCYYRSNPFADGLNSIIGKTVAGRQLEIRKIDQLSTAESCQILLISPSQLDDFSIDAKTNLPSSLLTVTDRTNISTDLDSASPDGIILTLVRKGAKIGFEIDLSRSRKAGLKMSSEMLKHARIVGEDS